MEGLPRSAATLGGVTRLFLVRHGETDWNRTGRLQGTSEVPLNDAGRAQVKASAALLATRLHAQPTVVSSPLSRARETAHAIADVVGVPVLIDDRLIERAYGVWEGLNFEEREARDPVQNQVWRERREPAIEGYEGHTLVAERMKAAVADWMPRTTGDLVFVTHGSASRMLVESLLGLPTGGHTIGNLGNAAWSLLVPVTDGPWSLVQHNAGADA